MQGVGQMDDVIVCTHRDPALAWLVGGLMRHPPARAPIKNKEECEQSSQRGLDCRFFAPRAHVVNEYDGEEQGNESQKEVTGLASVVGYDAQMAAGIKIGNSAQEQEGDIKAGRVKRWSLSEVAAEQIAGEQVGGRQYNQHIFWRAALQNHKQQPGSKPGG